MKPPQVSITFEDLPSDPKARHEAIVDLFGQYAFWARRQSLETARELVMSKEARERLGKLFQAPFEEVARLDEDGQKAALELAALCLDSFAKSFLIVLSGTGVGNRLGASHAVRFRLVMEICDVENEEIVEEHVVNRDGKKYFPDYWTKWRLNTR